MKIEIVKSKLLILLFLANLVFAIAEAEDNSNVHGKQLFEKNWRPEIGQDGGDGLGPLFNETSCINCHHLGGSGGGGPVADNVHVLTVESINFRVGTERANSPRVIAAGVDALRKIHPGLIDAAGGLQPVLVLHRQSTNGKYESFRQSLIAQIDEALESRTIPNSESEISRRSIPRIKLSREVHVGSKPATLNVTFRVGQRNTPALFGAGLIDNIPDAFLISTAIGQENNNEVSGRPAQTTGLRGPVGKFGWRGQVASLRSFVTRACAVEMGLQTPTQDQPIDLQNVNYRPLGLDVDDDDIDALTGFVAAFEKPRRKMPESPTANKIVAAGEVAFNKVGCAQCHVEKIGSIAGIYSDLLLHDMGENLRGFAPATIQIVSERSVRLTRRTSPPSNLGGLQLSPSAGSYYGSPDAFTFGGSDYPPRLTFVPQRIGDRISNRTQVERRQNPTRIRNEWRTPPLWGVRDSAPYLHDGRAESVLQAIMLHGGEAEATTKRFTELSLPDQQALLAFLDTFVAPQISIATAPKG